jgi:hypothetical protein
MTISPCLAQRLGDFALPTASQPHPAPTLPDSPDADILRVIAIGSLTVVNQHILQMYQLGYAQPHEWSRPLPTANPNEIMRIMTKRIVSTSG